MGAYGRFAKYYDLIYHARVDYKGDCDFLEAIFQKFLAKRPQSIVDLGCGTGNHAILLGKRRYEVVGIDLSRPQLRKGRAKLRRSRLPVTLAYGDMRRFNLRRTFDAAICMFGGFGYLLPDRDVLSHFRHVRAHLVANGLYTFEFWQASGVKPGHRSWLLVERPLRLVRLDASEYDAARRQVTMTLRFLIFSNNRLRDHFTEVHTVRVYTLREIRKLLARSGFALEAAYAVTPDRKEFSHVQEDAFRVMAVARPVPKLRAR